MSDTLRDRVEGAIDDAGWFDGVHHTMDTGKAARDAIRLVMEHLAARAEAVDQEWDDAEEAFTDPRRDDRLDAVRVSGLYFHASDDYYSMPIGKQVAAWLREQLRTLEDAK